MHELDDDPEELRLLKGLRINASKLAALALEPIEFIAAHKPGAKFDCAEYERRHQELTKEADDINAKLEARLRQSNKR